ncbi:DUF4157 domain-containing protein [Agriterribacter sp.]|uniref:eCIS core domain-containing protein n=1 Tax=Agriterribacter sp. TaxID=2821509 RepID=UPI002C296FCE|nr:DUF4157 domain-containing protein [Agriterribacter sp.]HTN06762.1 DUF4157 domain-containing protein [Agriterribacter sp.]
MKTAEAKTASVATMQKANQPFFSREAEGSFFGDTGAREPSFFKAEPGYSVNGNEVLQTKLTIGQPNDKYEKEADVMADQVVQRLAVPEPFTKKDAGIQTKPLAANITPLVQKKCASCEQEEKLQKKEEEKDENELLKNKLQKKPIFESNAEPPDDEGNIQRKCAECLKEEKLQKKSDAANSPLVFSSIESSLSSSKGSGFPIPAGTREQMESSFGSGFSNVRLHTDGAAVQMNKNLHAQAFTHRSDIYFNAGKYNAASIGGKHLLAHELTHVVQQGGAGKVIQKQDAPAEHLTSLNEMLDRFDVPEDEVLSLLPQLTTVEKTTVTTDISYKNRMASAFDISEMVRAVVILSLPLEKKLEWVEAATSAASNINYADLQSIISTAPQPERDVLKTIRWRDFFVAVCDNSTIITAVTDLHFDLKTQLEWIEEEASPGNIDYSQIQPLITVATQPDRDVLKTNHWRGFFVGVCTNATIITAVTDLHFDLKTQLEWVEEEASPGNIDYSQIQPLITVATQPDRDVLKTDHWRDFFVGVCNNTTIKNALEDLSFDFLTTIKWLLEEVSISNIDFTWLCNIFKTKNVFPAGEEVIACAIMERDMRDGTFDSSPDHQPAGWITRAHNQLLVATQMGGLVGQTATWKPSNPASGTTFQLWASAPVQGPDIALGAITVINCWEMVMLAAFRSGVMTWPRIHAIYTSGAPDWFSFLVSQLSFNNRIPYNPASPAKRPVAGDVVFFDGAAHVALAAGTLDGMGRTMIYSFWPPPNTAFTAGGTIDDVKITTIEQLNDYWVGRGKPAFKIEFTTPNW